MTEADWQKPFVRSLAFLLGGDAIPTPDERGQRIVGDALLVLLNAHHEPVRFTVPHAPEGRHWVLEFYTADDTGSSESVKPGPFELTGRSLAVFREARATATSPCSPQRPRAGSQGVRAGPLEASGDCQGGGPA